MLRRDTLAVDRWSSVLVALQCHKSNIAFLSLAKGKTEGFFSLPHSTADTVMATEHTLIIHSTETWLLINMTQDS